MGTKRSSKNINDNSISQENISYKKYDYIIGPITLTELYSAKYNKRIYIFGDIHALENDCNYDNSIRIDQFISETVTNNPDKIIDLFLEVSKNDYNREEKFNYIDYVTDTFESCLINKCKEHDNLRVHFTDLREVITEFKNFNSELLGLDIYFKLLEEESLKSSQLSDSFDSKAHYIEEINDDIKKLKKNKFLKLNKNNYKKFLYNYLEIYKTKLRDLYKQSDRSNQLSMKYFKNFFKKCIDNELKSLNIDDKFWQKWDEFNNFIKKKSVTYEDVLSNKYLIKDIDKIKLPIMCVMDYYAMIRLFKIFNIENLEKKRTRIDSKTVNNAIFYAGDIHANYYIDFLKSLGFEIINQTKQNKSDLYRNSRCINISQFKQPFFT
jgi:hypothetical protein